METVETFEHKGLNIFIHPDFDPESPRDFCNVGTMACWHRRYNLGDKHDFREPSDFQDYIADKSATVLPLYLYDHSGLAMNTDGFHCPWDSGQVGWIYVLDSDARGLFGWKRISAKRRAELLNYLRSEVGSYNDYLSGNVYGYRVEDKDGVELDSCWGLYGLNWARREAKSYADNMA